MEREFVDIRLYRYTRNPPRNPLVLVPVALYASTAPVGGVRKAEPSVRQSLAGLFV